MMLRKEKERINNPLINAKRYESLSLCFVSQLRMYDVRQAATIVAELPESQSVSQTATMARTSGQQLLDKVKGLQNGIYAGGNNNSVGNWSVNGEGTWVNQDDVGSITLCGRSGVAGSSFAMVLGGPQEGDSVSSITFSCNTPSSVINSYSMVLAVYDSTGTLVEELSKIQDFSFTSTSETTTISLDMSAAPLTWEEGYKVVAGVRGGAGTATSAYTITGIQVSYETVPEPAAASLGLLGLGAMLLRRRRS